MSNTNTVVCLVQGEEGRTGLDGERGPTVNYRLLSSFYIQTFYQIIKPEQEGGATLTFGLCILHSAHWKAGYIRTVLIHQQFKDT